MSESVKQFRMKFVALLLLIVVAFSLYGCGGTTLSSNWTHEEIRVDGKIDDWTDLKTVYFEDETLSLGIANDSANIYLMVRTRNEIFARSVRMSGLRLKLQPKMNNSRAMNIVYRGGDFVTLPRRPRGEGMRENGMNGPDRKESFTISTKKRLTEMEISTDGSNGPSVHSDTSMTFYVYEFAIPLTETLVRYYGLDAPVGSKIEVTAAWGGMDREMMRPDPSFDGGSRGGSGGGIPGMGGGRGGGGGKGGGGRGGGQHSSKKRQEMQAHEVKFDIQLSSIATESN